MNVTGSIDVSIIIVSYNVKMYLLECLASIKANCRNLSYEIIVVDNNSTDGSADAIERLHPDIVLIRNMTNDGFAIANNRGYERSMGEFILLLNPDTLLQRRSIDGVLEFMREEPSAGIATCRVVDEDGAPQKVSQAFPTIARNIAGVFFVDRLSREKQRRFYYGAKPIRVDYVSGAFMFIRRSALGPGPLLNPDYFMYAEEKDLALRLRRAGWHTYFIPDGEIIHFGGRSTALMPARMFLELQKSQAKFYMNHYPAAYALALCMSWWLVLVSVTMVSFPLFFSAKARIRLPLFARAAAVFPGYVLKLFSSRRRAIALPQGTIA